MGKSTRLLDVAHVRTCMYALVCVCFFIIVGLDAAGKTTILYKLKLGEIVTTIPTIGVRGRGEMGELRGWGTWRGALYFVLLQALTWKLWSIRTSASPCGTWEGRTRSGHCGGITSPTPRWAGRGGRIWRK